MRKSLLASLLLLVFVQSVGLLYAAPLDVPPPQEPVWEITSPAANARLRGTVEIRGSAYLGDNLFWKYMVYYAPLSAAEEWHQIKYSEQQVIDGLLATWNTTMVPDGAYVLYLRVAGKNAQYNEAPPRQVVVANAEPTATPTPTETPTPSPTVAIPSPTVVVVQPTSVIATSTPVILSTRTTVSELPGSITLPDTSTLFRSLLFGGLVAGALFVFLGVVALIKRLL